MTACALLFRLIQLKKSYLNEVDVITSISILPIDREYIFYPGSETKNYRVESEVNPLDVWVFDSLEPFAPSMTESRARLKRLPCSWQRSFYTDAFATRRPHSEPPPTLGRCVIRVSRCAGIRREKARARASECERANGTAARATHLYRSAYTYYKSASDTQPNLNFTRA